MDCVFVLEEYMKTTLIELWDEFVKACKETPAGMLASTAAVFTALSHLLEQKKGSQ